LQAASQRDGTDVSLRYGLSTVPVPGLLQLYIKRASPFSYRSRGSRIARLATIRATRLDMGRVGETGRPREAFHMIAATTRMRASRATGRDLQGHRNHVLPCWREPEAPWPCALSRRGDRSDRGRTRAARGLRHQRSGGEAGRGAFGLEQLQGPRWSRSRAFFKAADRAGIAVERPKPAPLARAAAQRPTPHNRSAIFWRAAMVFRLRKPALLLARGRRRMERAPAQGRLRRALWQSRAVSHQTRSAMRVSRANRLRLGET